MFSVYVYIDSVNNIRVTSLKTIMQNIEKITHPNKREYRIKIRENNALTLLTRFYVSPNACRYKCFALCANFIVSCLLFCSIGSRFFQSGTGLMGAPTQDPQTGVPSTPWAGGYPNMTATPPSGECFVQY